MATDSNIQKETLTKTDRKHCLEYTNRRRITPEALDRERTNEEQKEENNKDFEEICVKLNKCSLTRTKSNGKPLPKTPHSASSSSTSTSSSSQYSCHPAVEEFQRFLDERGGHYGGWKEKDHLFFIKTRKKCPLNKVCEMVNANFPDITGEKVTSHDAWYREYLRLRHARKQAIEEWKKSLKPPPKVEEKVQEAKPQSIPIRRDPKIKEKIEIWKAHCLAKKLERLEEQKEEEKKKKEESDGKKKLQEEKRILVNHYREEKLSYDIAKKAAEEMDKLEEKRHNMQKTAALLKYFRYEDRRFTERQRAKRLPLPVKERSRKEAVVEGKRDPSRLLKPTLAYLHHTKRPDTSDHTSTPVYIHHLSKLGKPSWRRGVTSL